MKNAASTAGLRPKRKPTSHGPTDLRTISTIRASRTPARAVTLPLLTDAGDLPPGVHRASLAEVFERFGVGSARRRLVALRLQRVRSLLSDCGHVSRTIVFGSFVSDKLEPNDVDVFVVMDDAFDLAAVSGEARLLFDHAVAQSHFGASVFWVRRLACFPSEEEMIAGWAIKRDGTSRGIVELDEVGR